MHPGGMDNIIILTNNNELKTPNTLETNNILTNNNKSETNNYRFTLPINKIPKNSLIEGYYDHAKEINPDELIEMQFNFSLGTMRIIEHYFYDFSNGNYGTLKEHFSWPDIYNLSKEQQFIITVSDLKILNYSDFLYFSRNKLHFLNLKNKKYNKFLKKISKKEYSYLLPKNGNKKLYATKTYIYCLARYLCLDCPQEYIDRSYFDDLKTIKQIVDPVNRLGKEMNIQNETNKLISLMEEKITYLNRLNDDINFLFDKIKNTKTSNIEKMTNDEKEYIYILSKYFRTLIRINKLSKNNLIKTNANAQLKEKIFNSINIIDAYDIEYVKAIEFVNYRLFRRPLSLSYIFEEKSCRCNSINSKSSINDILRTEYNGCYENCIIDEFDPFYIGQEKELFKGELEELEELEEIEYFEEYDRGSYY